MSLRVLADCLRAARKNSIKISDLAMFMACLRVLRVSRKPQARKKPNDFNACGLAGLAALKRTLPHPQAGCVLFAEPSGARRPVDKIGTGSPMDSLSKPSMADANYSALNTSDALRRERRLG